MGILKEQFNHGGVTKSGLLIDGVKLGSSNGDQRKKPEGNTEESAPPPANPSKADDKDKNSAEDA